MDRRPRLSDIHFVNKKTSLEKGKFFAFCLIFIKIEFSLIFYGRPMVVPTDNNEFSQKLWIFKQNSFSAIFFAFYLEFCYLVVCLLVFAYSVGEIPVTCENCLLNVRTQVYPTSYAISVTFIFVPFKRRFAACMRSPRR